MPRHGLDQGRTLLSDRFSDRFHGSSDSDVKHAADASGGRARSSWSLPRASVVLVVLGGTRHPPGVRTGGHTAAGRRRLNSRLFVSVLFRRDAFTVRLPRVALRCRAYADAARTRAWGKMFALVVTANETLNGTALDLVRARLKIFCLNEKLAREFYLSLIGTFGTERK